jgi:hypothetical protein
MDDNKAVTAVFAINAYSLDVTVAGPGTVTKNPNLGTYNHGTSVQLTATPADGARFVRWEGALTGATNPATVGMDADKAITCVFSNEPYLEVLTSGSGSVIAQISGTTDSALGALPYGTQVALSAVASDGWYLDHWEGDLAGTDRGCYITVTDFTRIKAVILQGAP